MGQTVLPASQREDTLARRPGCGKPLRASATTRARKLAIGTQGNDLGYGKNAEDWAIRRAGPKPAMVGHGPLSETAKASVTNEGLATLRLLKVQSGLLGD